MNEISIKIVSKDLSLQDIIEIRNFTSYSLEEIKAAHQNCSELHLLDGNLFWESASIVEFLGNLKCEIEVFIDGETKKTNELIKLSKEAKRFNRADM